MKFNTDGKLRPTVKISISAYLMSLRINTRCRRSKYIPVFKHDDSCWYHAPHRNNPEAEKISLKEIKAKVA